MDERTKPRMRASLSHCQLGARAKAAGVPTSCHVRYPGCEERADVYTQSRRLVRRLPSVTFISLIAIWKRRAHARVAPDAAPGGRSLGRSSDQSRASRALERIARAALGRARSLRTFLAGAPRRSPLWWEGGAEVGGTMASGRRRQKHSSSTSSSSSLSPPSSPAISMRDMGRPRGGERADGAGARPHAVVRGDTLAGLALRYGVTGNNLGMRLKLPTCGENCQGLQRARERENERTRERSPQAATRQSYPALAVTLNASQAVVSEIGLNRACPRQAVVCPGDASSPATGGFMPSLLSKIRDLLVPHLLLFVWSSGRQPVLCGLLVAHSWFTSGSPTAHGGGPRGRWDPAHNAGTPAALCPSQTEQIRRANHLFANESLFLRTTLLIPVPGPPDCPDNGNSGGGGRTAEPAPLANGGEGTAGAAGSNGTKGPIGAAATAGKTFAAGTGGGGGSGSDGKVEAAHEDGRPDAAPDDEVTASDFFSRIDARLERTRANLGHGGGHGSPAVTAKRGATAT
ncbi:unnamed protein product [Lampetra fluviatilis]